MIKSLGICGFGFSGSGAIIDLIKRNSNVVYPKIGEFTLTYLPDGIKDLRYNLFNNCSRFFSSDIGILRFRKRVKMFCKEKGYSRKTVDRIMEKCDTFISNIAGVKWRGFWKYDLQESSSFIKRIKYRLSLKMCRFLKHPERHKPYRTMFFSIKPDFFLENAKFFLEEVLYILGASADKFTLLDQNVPSNNPLEDLSYFNNAKIIIVDRDPRDVFLLAKKTLKQEASWIPTEDINSFINYYKMMRLNDGIEDSRILRIQFEDLIYETDKTIQTIEKFIGFKIDLDNSDFFPNVSINNTQLFVDNNKYSYEIARIEEKLKKYLYDFSLHRTKPNRNSKAF